MPCLSLRLGRKDRTAIGDGGWKILSLLGQVENPSDPTPREGGVSGRCR